MHRLMLTAAAIVLVCGTHASAADLSFDDQPGSAPTLWSGLYIGGHVGALWNKGRETSAESDWCRNFCLGYGPTDAVTFEDDGNETSVVGGLHIGHNWQDGATVFGVEADLGFADGFDYLGTVRARLGYARDGFLLYATAGAAFAGVDTEPFRFSTPQRAFDISDDDDRRIGFVVGGGVEYKLDPNWSLGVEGLYYRFGDTANQYESNFEIGCSGLCYENYRISERDDNDLWTVRARMTYHLTDQTGSLK